MRGYLSVTKAHVQSGIDRERIPCNMGSYATIMITIGRARKYKFVR
ncbi:MAG TPA: hypothetical protein PKZ42_11135 [Syntrophales bacterium]|nr:hypothetical protein [Syntrophales bacterium]